MFKNLYIVFVCVFFLECLIIFGQKKDVESFESKTSVNENGLKKEKKEYILYIYI